MSEPTVDIAGIDKVVLLKALWENQRVARFYENVPHMAPKWDEKLAKEIIEAGPIDYFQGRCIKTNLLGDTMYCSTYYDADAKTPCASVVAALKRTK